MASPPSAQSAGTRTQTATPQVDPRVTVAAVGVVAALVLVNWWASSWWRKGVKACSKWGLLRPLGGNTVEPKPREPPSSSLHVTPSIVFALRPAAAPAHTLAGGSGAARPPGPRPVRRASEPSTLAVCTTAPPTVLWQAAVANVRTRSSDTNTPLNPLSALLS